VIVRGLSFDRHLDFVVCAIANERSAREVLRRGFYSSINRWMYLDSVAHGRLSFWMLAGAVWAAAGISRLSLPGGKSPMACSSAAPAVERIAADL
jgi:hypothetical protein